MSESSDPATLADRLAALTDRLAALEGLADRLDALEARLDAIAPAPDARPADLEAAIARIDRLETRLDADLALLPDLARYGPLRDRLAAGQWTEADRETTRVLLEVAGQDRNSLTPEGVRQLPCNALATIDRLWTRYSSGRYGFSVQLRLYLEVGGSRDTLTAQNNKILMALGERANWRRADGTWKASYAELGAIDSGPPGMLPANWFLSPYGMKMTNFFFLRLLSCNLAG